MHINIRMVEDDQAKVNGTHIAKPEEEEEDDVLEDRLEDVGLVKAPDGKT